MADGTMRSKSKVLVVEDDAVTRMGAVSMLQEAGYAVVEAHNGTAAMLMLENDDGIRVMLTDIDMPAGINGIVLAACVDRRWPSVGIIMTSGKVKPVPGDIPTRGRFVPKPYSYAALLCVIGDVTADIGRAGALVASRAFDRPSVSA